MADRSPATKAMVSSLESLSELLVTVTALQDWTLQTSQGRLFFSHLSPNFSITFGTFTNDEMSILEFFQNHREKFAMHPWFTIEPMGTHTEINLGTNMATVYMNISVAETPSLRVDGYIQFQWARASDEVISQPGEDEGLSWGGGPPWQCYKIHMMRGIPALYG